MAINLAKIIEQAPFKDDVNKLKAFIEDIEKSTDLQDFVKKGKDFSKEWDLLEKAGRDIKLRGNKAAIEALFNNCRRSRRRSRLASDFIKSVPLIFVFSRSILAP